MMRISQGIDHLGNYKKTQSGPLLIIDVKFRYRPVDVSYVLEKSWTHETISEAVRP